VHNFSNMSQNTNTSKVKNQQNVVLMHVFPVGLYCLIMLSTLGVTENYFLALCSCDRASWAKREERIPTRCNNIDDLLSIPDVIIDYSLDMFRASLFPSSGEKTTCYCIWGIFAGSVGCGRLRYCGAMLRVWSLWRLLLDCNLPHPTLPANIPHRQ